MRRGECSVPPVLQTASATTTEEEPSRGPLRLVLVAAALIAVVATGLLWSMMLGPYRAASYRVEFHTTEPAIIPQPMEPFPGEPHRITSGIEVAANESVDAGRRDEASPVAGVASGEDEPAAGPDGRERTGAPGKKPDKTTKESAPVALPGGRSGVHETKRDKATERPAPSGAPENGREALTPAEIVDIDRRPAWVDAEPFDEHGARCIPASSGPAKSPDEARRKLRERMRDVVRKHAADEIQKICVELEGTPIPWNSFPKQWSSVFEQSQLLEALVGGNRYEERIESSSYGTYYQAHALLRFDRSSGFEIRVRNVAREAWAIHRAWRFVVGALWVLGLLAAAWIVLSLPLFRRMTAPPSTSEGAVGYGAGTGTA